MPDLRRWVDTASLPDVVFHQPACHRTVGAHQQAQDLPRMALDVTLIPHPAEVFWGGAHESVPWTKHRITWLNQHATGLAVGFARPRIITPSGTRTHALGA